MLQGYTNADPNYMVSNAERTNYARFKKKLAPGLDIL